MTNLELYDEKAALNHIKTLEFKRLAGTDGEIKTINYLFIFFWFQLTISNSSFKNLLCNQMIVKNNGTTFNVQL